MWKSLDKVVTQNIHNIFPFVLCVVSKLSWKFNENLLIDFSVMLLTEKRTNRDENIILAVQQR